MVTKTILSDKTTNPMQSTRELALEVEQNPRTAALPLCKKLTRRRFIRALYLIPDVDCNPIYRLLDSLW